MAYRIESSQPTIQLSEFDFCDFGCSNGGSIKFGQEILGGKKGFGVDIDPQKVIASRKSGYEAISGDFCDLDLPDQSVDFAILSHVLEHLPSLNHARLAIQNAIRVSKKFVFIQGPFFDADDYLKSLNLKFYWSDWTGHPLHFKSSHLIQILDDLQVQNYEVYGRVEIPNSSRPEIHPISSPKNQHDYELALHGKKASISFKHPVFKEILGMIWLSDDINNVEQIRRRSEKFLIQKRGLYFPLPIK